MIRRRFPAARLAGIVGWTAMATAWVTFGIARAARGPDPWSQPAPAPQQVLPAVAPGSVPDLPGGGLVIIRTAPDRAPAPETRVVTRVVEKRVVVQAAPRPSSGGS